MTARIVRPLMPPAYRGVQRRKVATVGRITTHVSHRTAGLVWVALAGLALLVGAGLYGGGRVALVSSGGLAAAWVGSVPAALHALAFSLLSASLLRARGQQLAACAGWCAANLLFEIGQHPALAPGLSRALDAMYAGPVAHYFAAGTFDVLDLLAAIAGALLAAAVICGIPTGRLTINDKEPGHG